MPSDFSFNPPKSLTCVVCGSTAEVQDRRELPGLSWQERIVSEDPLAPPQREGLALLLCPECARQHRERLFQQHRERLFQQLYRMMF